MMEPGCIAIVGMAGRFPGARTPSELWKLLEGGREATRWLTPDELRAAGVEESLIRDPDYVPATLPLPDMEMFDAGFFGFSRRDAEIMDPQHRHFLETVWEALEDAGHMPERFEGAIGVFGGCGMQAYLPYNLLTNPELVKSMGMFLLRHTGNDKDFLCSRVSYLLDLKGPSMSIQTACSTSLVAVHVASQSLLAGECDMAIAGGVSIELPHGQGYRHAEGEIMSPDGHCRAFDENAAGTLFGSGAAVVVLRRLEDAVRDGDNIHAVIRGSAVNNDGSGKAGYFAPSVDGQARAAAEALAVAGVEPATIGYIEAHGTGTPVGDPIEVAALSQAYRTAGTGQCGLGSLKTNIGHLDTAAGAAGLIKVALALRHGLLPASLNFSRPNPRMNLGSTPFRIVDSAQPWPRTGSVPRRAAVNSLGVGGTNAHVIVEEAPEFPREAGPASWEVFTLSARSAQSLEALKAKWSEFLQEPQPGFDLGDAAHTLQVGRRAFPHRFSAAARDVPGLRAALAAKTASSSPAAQGQEAPPVVFMFPGGGAQYPGAGREFLAHAAFRDAVDECFAALPADAPAGLRELMFGEATEATSAELQKPGRAIPALFVLEYAIARLWLHWGVRPAAMIGHSAGEYAAACIAGALSLPDALAIVVLRGRLFEQAAPGGMLAVDLGAQELKPLADALGLDIAAINAPDLSIASGEKAALEALAARLSERGVEARALHIDVAAHSKLLDPLLATFRERLSGLRFGTPAIEFISTLTGQPETTALASADYWTRHLREPVRFSDALAHVALRPGAILLEVGPGQGLGALARQNGLGAGRLVAASTAKAKDPQGDMAAIMAAAGALWTRGVTPDWSAMRAGAPRRRISLPTYAFEHQRHWIEPGIRAIAEAPAAAPAQPQGIQRLASTDDWFRALHWDAAPLAAEAGAGDGRWLIFGGRSQLTTDLVREIQGAGGTVTLVRRDSRFARLDAATFSVCPSEPEHYDRLLEALAQDGVAPQRILHLWSLDTMPGGGGRRIPDQALAFDSLVAIANALQRLDASHAVRLVSVTSGSQSVRGEAVPHPERALALGPTKVMGREVAGVRATMADFDAADIASGAAASSIVREALAGTEELVAWRSGERLAPHWREALAAHPSRAWLRDRGAYLLTGGFGDIALSLAEWLARTHHARVALVGRRKVPARSNWKALAAGAGDPATVRLARRLLAIEEAGGEVLAFSADATDPQAMARVIGQCRSEFGHLHGVFHAAGVMEDGLMATRPPEAMQRVLAPKVAGAQVLHELLPPGDLDVFAVFSSTSVLLGAAGQADYVAANACIDAIAAARPDGLAIHWGIWGDRGMAARAWGEGPEPEGPALHPLLGARLAAQEGAAFQARLDGSEWFLAEHRVAGRAVLPGTAYIEMARAALAVLHPGSGLDMRALSFEAPLVVQPGEPRTVRTELEASQDGYDFVVRSRGRRGAPWQEHARAHVARLSGALPGMESPAPVWQPGALPQTHVDFGPRWRNVERMALKDRFATAELALAPAFAGDLTEFAAHPALLDMAATCGLNLLPVEDRAARLYAPLSAARIRIAAPAGPRLVSRAQWREGKPGRLATFDVSLTTPEGAAVAFLEGFCLRGVDPGALSVSEGKAAPTLAEQMLDAGLRGEDAPMLFERIFSSGARDIVVSSISVDALRAAATPPPAAPARARRTANPAAHRDPVEAMLADAWCELLGVEEVSGDDDFFALGGHSLAAVRLFARIRKHTGVDLPLATLFEAPTLSALAAVVNREAGTSAGSAPARRNNVIPLGTRAWSPLVTICKGEPDRTPLFCVHGAGGNVLNFKVISDRLGPELPFYGLQAQGVDGRLQPLGSIEEMAAQYVDAIRAVDSHGPYQLAGYSAGGVIALEMAQRLRKLGATVSLLAMIDTLAPTAARRRTPAWRKLWMMRTWSLEFLMAWPERRRKGKAADISYAQALERLARGEPLPPELVEFHLFRSFVSAQARYTPAPYDGPVVLFKASQADTQYLGAGPALGWEEHLGGPIRVHEVSGSHFTMMSEPGVSELIAGLRHELGLGNLPPSKPPAPWWAALVPSRVRGAA